MDSIETALAALARGGMAVVVDDEDRENEGDLLMDARFADAERVNFMATHGRGLICVPMEEARLRELEIGAMVARNGDPHGTAFTVSVDHRDSSTGISAAERAATIQALASAASVAADFRKPGHVFPLAAKEGGVLARRGHTEAAVDLARLARAFAGTAGPRADGPVRPYAEGAPCGVICEIMKPDGAMARLPDLEAFAARHGLPLVSIADLVRWRRARERLVEAEADTQLPTRYGIFRARGYREIHSGAEHLALSLGELGDGHDVLCRVHSECLTGDALGSSRCDCGEQYDKAMRLIAAEGRGVLVYLRQEGRGIGLLNKLKAYALQDTGLDTVDANLRLGFPADARDYHVGAQILRDLGVRSLRLLSNNPAKIRGLEDYGIEIRSRVPLQIEANPHNEAYLRAKADRMSHMLAADRHAALG